VKHAKLLRENGWFNNEQKNLLRRVTGRFYTPETIGKHLCEAVVRAAVRSYASANRINIVDPFCGDGRLIAWFLEFAKSECALNTAKWVVHLWDSDAKAVRDAVRRVDAAGKRLGASVSVEPHCWDTFPAAANWFDTFDIVLTNPPWDTLKPDRRELQTLGKTKSRLYIAELRAEREVLAQLFPLAQPSVRFAGWGTNLSRCGTELAIRLGRRGGIIGVVSPASLMADQVSERLRSWIINQHELIDLACFPAESRLFEDVDQPSLTMVLRRDGQFSNMLRLTIYDERCQPNTRPAYALDAQYLRSVGYRLPLQFGFSGLRLLSKLQPFPTFASLEAKNGGSLWAGRELDETGHVDFLKSRGQYFFAKGRMIGRFGVTEQPTLYVCPQTGPAIPKSADHWRIAWRDVSRPSQQRRMHATLIPPGWVTGNSLSVAYFKDDNRVRLKALLAVLNSYAFELQVRAFSATAHVSLGTVRGVRVPSLDNQELTNRLARLADRCLRRYPESYPNYETSVADAYGLSAAEFSELVAMFVQRRNGRAPNFGGA
jgi:Alw26I/Eco31I/Esp3I family type II restriction m6 adenine DNA methyltransferase